MSGENKRGGGYYFTTRDLVVIAILCALGGVLSTYVGYLGNLIDRALGVPFGAGQVMAGLHVFWFILAMGIVRKTGTGTIAGVLKGVIEMLMGSTHGVVIILVSCVEGLLVDLCLLPFRERHSLRAYSVAGGVSACSNVFIFQAIYFSGVPITYILIIAGLALVSGVVFGGYFGKGILDSLLGSRVVRVEKERLGGRIGLHSIVSIVLALSLIGGAGYYFTQVFHSPWGGASCTIQGNVENPYTYYQSDFEVVTITTEGLQGATQSEPPTDYTGVPLNVILLRVSSDVVATVVRVIAPDGYEVSFDLDEVMNDDEMILIEEGDSLRLIAANYTLTDCVRHVTEIIVE